MTHIWHIYMHDGIFITGLHFASCCGLLICIIVMINLTLWSILVNRFKNFDDNVKILSSLLSIERDAGSMEYSNSTLPYTENQLGRDPLLTTTSNYNMSLK